MAARAQRRVPRGLVWKSLAVTLFVMPLIGLWAYSIFRSAGHIYTLLDGRPPVPVPTFVATSDQAPGATRPTDEIVDEAARVEAVPGADEVRSEPQSTDSAEAHRYRDTADLLPLFEEYLIEADAEQAKQIAEAVEEFLPAQR